MEQTKDYKKFKNLNFNRELNKSHIEKLKQSIMENGYLSGYPVLVNRNFEILDGQHRFEALKELNMSVPYQIADVNYDAIIALNTAQKKWDISDYVRYYAEKEKNSNYTRLKRVCEELKEAPTLILSLNGHDLGGAITGKLKKGQLKFTIDDELRIKDTYEKITKAAAILKLPVSSRLVSAFKQLSTREGFDWSIMLHKSKMFPTLAHRCVRLVEYVEMLKYIYNFNTKIIEKRI